MKKLFPGYYNQDDTEVERLWKNALFIFDTNVLVDLFRFSEKSSQSLLSVLTKIKDRIWIPYHVAQEYHKGIYPELYSQARTYDEVAKQLKELQKKLNDEKKHPFVSREVSKEITEPFNKLIQGLTTKKKELLNSILKHPIKEQIANLFDGKVGDEFSDEELENLYEEGKKRFEKNIPPGYQDIGKPEPYCYGDWIIWKSLLNKATQVKSGMIFVTSDAKEDWFLKEKDSNKILCPHPELITEIKKVKDIDFNIYSLEKFLELSNKYLKTKIESDVISEIKDFEEKEAKITLANLDFIKQNFDNSFLTNKIYDIYKIDPQAILNVKEVYQNLFEGIDIARKRQIEEIEMLQPIFRNWIETYRDNENKRIKDKIKEQEQDENNKNKDANDDDQIEGAVLVS